MQFELVTAYFLIPLIEKLHFLYANYLKTDMAIKLIILKAPSDSVTQITLLRSKATMLNRIHFDKLSF